MSMLDVRLLTYQKSRVIIRLLFIILLKLKKDKDKQLGVPVQLMLLGQWTVIEYFKDLKPSALDSYLSSCLRAYLKSIKVFITVLRY